MRAVLQLSANIFGRRSTHPLAAPPMFQATTAIQLYITIARPVLEVGLTSPLAPQRQNGVQAARKRPVNMGPGQAGAMYRLARRFNNPAVQNIP